MFSKGIINLINLLVISGKMVSIKKEGVLLKKTNLSFENKGVLNPAVLRDGDFVHLYYRAINEANESTIGYCRLKGPLMIEERLQIPLIVPQFEYESIGVEDPRIVKIDDLVYLTYTAYDGINALGALAVAKDYLHFEKFGLITPQISYDDFFKITAANKTINEKYYRYNINERVNRKEGKNTYLWDKNLLFFPRKINNKFYFLHRIRPDIQIVSVDTIQDLTYDFWQNYLLHLEEHIVLKPKYEHEISYIGGGCPPIETSAGWLLIYHGVQDSIQGYIYSACAALLDIDNPKKEISRLEHVLFKPEKIWKTSAELNENRVCFPTGTALFDDILYIYYGDDDEEISCASLPLNELVNELIQHRI
jgi:predicted GH43/DUF377 family glycosyl hydrolase